MADTYAYTAGRTALIIRQLLADDEVIDGSALTVALELRDRAGGLVVVAGNVSWLSAGVGTVQYQPAAGDLVAARSPYAARWTLTDGSGFVDHAPSGAPEKWQVYP